MAEIIQMPIRSVYKDGSIVVSNVKSIIDNTTTSYSVVDTWYDSTPMDDSKVDQFGIYSKYKPTGEYLRENKPQWGELFLEVDTVADLRAMTPYNQFLIRIGYFKGVRLSGYYVKGDTPGAINYFKSSTINPDDGGSVFEVSGIKFEHDFKGVADISYFGAIGANGNFIHILIKALAKVDTVTVDGEFTITEVLPQVLVNKKILGASNASKFIIDPSLINGTIFQIGKNSSIQGIEMVGNMPTPNVSSSIGSFDTIDGALNFDGIGNVNLAKLSDVSSFLRNVTIHNFSGKAVVTSKNNIGNLGLSVNSCLPGCRIYHNYIGLDLPQESEYLSFSDCWINYNVIGVNKAGGNNNFSNCHVDHNRVNFITRKGANNSHGSFVGGSLNHAKFAAIIADEITNGDVFSGVNIFDGGKWGIYVRRSLGLNFSGCLLGRMPIYCVGIGLVGSAPGINKFQGNTFNLNSLGSAATNKVYRNFNEETGLSDPSTPDNFEFRDNVHMEGDSRRDSSNWDPQFINDYHFPDSNGFMYGETIAGAQGSRYVSGKPVDGAKFINGIGAIAIELPIPNFNNTQLSLDIDISSTGAAKSAKLQFSSYAITTADGTWTGSTWINVGGYKIRLGRKSDGRPVIYIGELATSFTNTLVRINNITVHMGAYALSKYWQKGWVIRQETSAFENKTQESPDIVNTGIADYNGDLNDIATTVIYHAVSAINRPIAENGFIETFIRGSSVNTRLQKYTSVVSGKIFTRGTTSGVLGYTAWV